MICILFWIIVSILIFGSCTTTKYIPVNTIKTDTIFKASKDSVKLITLFKTKDSINIRDSVVLHVNDKGEVTGKDTWHWRDRFKAQKDSTSYYKNVS